MKIYNKNGRIIGEIELKKEDYLKCLEVENIDKVTRLNGFPSNSKAIKKILSYGVEKAEELFNTHMVYNTVLVMENPFTDNELGSLSEYMLISMRQSTALSALIKLETENGGKLKGVNRRNYSFQNGRYTKHVLEFDDGARIMPVRNSLGLSDSEYLLLRKGRKDFIIPFINITDSGS